MVNLKDVPDMNVGDMVNEYTSRYNVSYTTHVTDVVIPYVTRYYNLGTTVYYNLCQVFNALNLTIGLSD
jgi:hypothetical protein